MADPADPSTGAASSAEAPVRTLRQQELDARLEKATGIKQRTVEISDARGIRALAHVARQQVMEVLFASSEPFTSTQLAKLTGLTPSAMSYHLRALERWGVVERVTESEDGRQRPWRATGTSIHITGGSSASAVGAVQDLHTRAYEGLEGRIRAGRQLPPEERARYVGMSQGEYWLNDDEIDYLALAVQRALVELAEQGWADREGEGRKRVATLWSILPTEPSVQHADGGTGADRAEDDQDEHDRAGDDGSTG